MKKKLLIIADGPATYPMSARHFAADFDVVQKANGVEALEWLTCGNRPKAIVANYDRALLNW